MQGDLEKTTHFSYTIPSDTVIAFSCTKMDIDEQGVLSMHVGVDKVDNIDAKMASPVDRSEEIKRELQSLVSNEKFAEIKNAILNVLKAPACIEEMLELVSINNFQLL